MNTIIGNSSYIYRHTQQAGKQNHIRTGNGNWGHAAESVYEDAEGLKTKDSGISAQEAYERSHSGKTLPEAGQEEEYKDKSVEVSDTEQLPSTEDEILKVTDIEVASLSNGVSFYFNKDTGEVSCVNDNDSRPGRQILWSKTLSPEDMERCNKMFDNYADIATGHFVFRFQAYMKHEEFWDMYLDGKVDLGALTEKDDALSEDELYDKFLRDMESSRIL